MTQPIGVCNDRAAWCYCAGEPDHDGPHVCAVCGGSWEGDYDKPASFRIITLPSLPDWLEGS